MTKGEVKMARFWPSSFFACLWTNRRRNKLARKGRGQYPAILTERARSIKDLLYGKGTFLRDTADNPVRAG